MSLSSHHSKNDENYRKYSPHHRWSNGHRISLSRGFPERRQSGNHLRKKRESAIVNITSGLAFTPLAVVPIYCATKAGLHSFSQSLRHQLRNTSIKVFEVAPPIVDTELDRGARENREQESVGILPVEVAEAALLGMKEDQLEIVIGLASNLRSAPEKMFNIINP